MGRLLGTAILALSCLWPGTGRADGADTRHQFEIQAAVDHVGASSTHDRWTEGGTGKLRYADGSAAAGRLLATYRGRITNTLWVEAALDYDGLDDDTIGLTEIELAWRPVPVSKTRHRVRFGAMYPPFSLENGGIAWSSPFGTSFSAINAWLAEEIRPVGAEWQMSRRLGDAGSRHEIGAFGSIFYGNDPAASLLFWRGWALHDRQTRLNERIPLPDRPVFDDNGNVTGTLETRLDPIAEIDHRPGFYAGLEWELSQRVLTRLGRYDNRADPEAFNDGQWGWNTRFLSFSTQVALPADVGLIAQWMDGTTDWLMFVTTTGLYTPDTKLVSEAFNSNFVLLTRPFGPHRLSVRRDRFRMHREPALTIDDGSAISLSYRYETRNRMSLSAEYLRVETARDLWPYLHGLPREATDRQLTLTIRFDLTSGR